VPVNEFTEQQKESLHKFHDAVLARKLAESNAGKLFRTSQAETDARLARAKQDATRQLDDDNQALIQRLSSDIETATRKRDESQRRDMAYYQAKLRELRDPYERSSAQNQEALNSALAQAERDYGDAAQAGLQSGFTRQCGQAQAEYRSAKQEADRLLADGTKLLERAKKTLALFGVFYSFPSYIVPKLHEQGIPTVQDPKQMLLMNLQNAQKHLADLESQTFELHRMEKREEEERHKLKVEQERQKLKVEQERQKHRTRIRINVLVITVLLALVIIIGLMVRAR
jgi:hypothetical protein